MSHMHMTERLKAALSDAGVENYQAAGSAHISTLAEFEAPSSIKWMTIENEFVLSAFSYAVSGYFSRVTIGRYVSIGEQVQIGRSPHPIRWMSTSPFTYQGAIIPVGDGFPHAREYRAQAHLPSPELGIDKDLTISIGHDVYIGHGAFVMPGVSIGTGAVVAAGAIVTKDVAPYTIVAGNPAVPKRARFSPGVVDALLASEWWRYASWDLTTVRFWDIEAALSDLARVRETCQPYEPQPIRIRDLPA